MNWDRAVKQMNRYRDKKIYWGNLLRRSGLWAVSKDEKEGALWRVGRRGSMAHRRRPEWLEPEAKRRVGTCQDSGGRKGLAHAKGSGGDLDRSSCGPLGPMMYFSVYNLRPAYSESLSKQKATPKKFYFSSFCAFKLHTYQSCMNTVGIRKGPWLSTAWGSSLLGRTKLPLSDSEDHPAEAGVTDLRGPGGSSQSELSHSEVVSSLAGQMNKAGLNNHQPGILETPAPAGELKLINCWELFQI